ncbi:MAG: hypothetical protein AUH30_07250 [Candidatus Rokubacteria bacterium 13_1_40CM_68_15]|nr:MAG: hypothetical protein AUH30_07250 [Candidatus Rokubacteria bacterium 13_1_40CM_68_15]
MFGLGKRICGFCGGKVPGKRALRAPDRNGAYVCKACYAQWEREGRRCVECQTPVAGAHDVGAFFERRAFGHADCGGMKLFA